MRRLRQRRRWQNRRRRQKGQVVLEYVIMLVLLTFFSLSLLALSSRDYPLQMALFAFAGALTLAGILISDLLYLAADPRIKLTRS